MGFAPCCHYLQVKQVDQLQTQHEQLVRRLSAMAAFEQQLAAAQVGGQHTSHDTPVAMNNTG